MSVEPTRLPILLERGSTEGADCLTCPFSVSGQANRPVRSEYPSDPKWLIVGEGPGHNEVRLGRPFVGMSGIEVNKVLARIGRPRDEVGILNATLCLPYQGASIDDKEHAAKHCHKRLQLELAKFPGKPILTLGAVAARAVIPQTALDAVDPPDVPKHKKRAQKERQKSVENQNAKKRLAKIRKLAVKLTERAINLHLGRLTRELKRKHGRAPDQRYLNQESYRVRSAVFKKCLGDAELELDQKAEEARLRKLAKTNTAGKPKKKKKVKITDIMSTAFVVDVDGSGTRTVIPAIHPAALLRGGGGTIGGTHSPDLAYVNLVADASKVNAIAQGKDIWLRFPVEIETVDSDRAVALFLEIFWEAIEEGTVAIDLETYVDEPERHTALMAYAAKIRAIGFATRNRAVSVLWDLLPSWCQSYLQVLLTRCKVIAQNGLYDRTVLRAYGFILDELWEDTLIGHAAAFPGCSHKLQQITSQFFAVESWKSEFRNQEETPERLCVYNAKDTFSTRKDHDVLQIMVKRTQTERAYARDLKMSEIASKMHLDGMPLDRDINNELVSQFSKLTIESRRAVEDRLHDPKLKDAVKHFLAIQQALKQRKGESPEFENRYKLRKGELDRSWQWKINSSDHIIAFLQGLGIQLHVTTGRDGKGKLSTRKEILEGLVHIEEVRDVLTFRENEKMLSTFLWPMQDRWVGDEIVQYGYCDENDRIHPIWSLPKLSGRWASRDPVVSNPTKEKGKGIPKELRGLLSITEAMEQGFIKRPTTKRQFKVKKGRKLVGFDFAQLEARIIALLSGDPLLLDIFSKGQDIHTVCAKVIFDGQRHPITGEKTLSFDDVGDGSGKQTPEQKRMRNVTKNVEYALFYGAQDETLWKTLLKDGFNLKLEDVKMASAKLKSRMPGVVRWQRETIVKASTPPYTLRDYVDGRMRVWPMGNVDMSEALNIGPQSTGAAIMDTGMERMDAHLPRFKQCFPIVQIHDASAYECWEDQCEKVKESIETCFPQSYTRDGIEIPFPIEVKIGDSLAEV